jgi:Peptidase family M28/Divergent InlB B-repeat domain/Fibronectin type III domain
MALSGVNGDSIGWIVSGKISLGERHYLDARQIRKAPVLKYPSFRFVVLLLLCVTAAREPVVVAVSAPDPLTSDNGQPLLDSDIFSMLDQVDANRISADIQTLVAFGTRNTCSDTSGASPGIGAARDWILNRYLSIPGLQVTLAPWQFPGCGDGTTRTLHNVIAWIPGSGHPNRLIVIGGHYDSRTTNGKDGVSPAPGANDSGSQTALVLEAARVMAGHVFDATIVFADWSGEEQALQGSINFVRNYRKYFPNGTLEFNLNSDIVGGDNSVNNATTFQQFRLFSPGTPREGGSLPSGSTDDTSPSRGIMRQIGYWGGAYVPSMTILPQLREDISGHTSDHTSFIVNSIPGVRFVEVNQNPGHRHSPNDLFVYVTPSYTARVTQVVVASAASLARAPTPPLNMVATGTSPTTVGLTWSPPASGSPVDHYVISARTSAENFYRTRKVISGDLTSATADVVQDLGIPPATAYYISIAAVDAANHESLYAYPEYRCDSTNTCSQPADALNVTATPTPTPSPTTTPTPTNTPTPTVQVTLQTIPAGVAFTVDGVTYGSTHTFSWTRGSSHTIGTTSPQTGGAGVRHLWTKWSDSGVISHTVAPTTDRTYTATFSTQYYLTMTHGTGGNVSPVSGWRNSGAAVSITATPASSYSFSDWTGIGTGFYSGINNPASITMGGPITETAAFTH